ncbi:DUF3102 domain-containing protein [Geminocystis herdmanii]|uniref:DUF3102 domain-containing protein n=1 Tax=Geminocystis herdmanii TaxID=669359 RepID=UPI00034838D2|nr:DUF3102 domain-containing protein [Geminocystis herdmanii]
MSELTNINVENQLSVFDYSSLSIEVAKLVKESAIEIKAREKAIWENIIEIGNKLIEVKNTLPHGKFQSWCELEFKWTIRTAQRYMKVSNQLGAKTTQVSHLETSLRAMYEIATSFTDSDQETQEKILEKVEIKTEEKGKALTEKEIKEIREEVSKKYQNQIKELENKQISLLTELKEQKLNSLKTIINKDKEIEKLKVSEKDKYEIRDLKTTLNRQKKMYNDTTQWLNSIEIMSNVLYETANTLKQQKRTLKIKPVLDELAENEKDILNKRMLERIASLNDNLREVDKCVNEIRNALNTENYTLALKTIDINSKEII